MLLYSHTVKLQLFAKQMICKILESFHEALPESVLFNKATDPMKESASKGLLYFLLHTFTFYVFYQVHVNIPRLPPKVGSPTARLR